MTSAEVRGLMVLTPGALLGVQPTGVIIMVFTRIFATAAGIAMVATIATSSDGLPMTIRPTEPDAVVVAYFERFAAGHNRAACELVAHSAADELVAMFGGHDCVSALGRIHDQVSAAGSDVLALFKDTDVRQISFEIPGRYAEINDDDISFGGVLASERDSDTDPLTLEKIDGVAWLISSFG